jgi:excisionase family DNA binding protein
VICLMDYITTKEAAQRWNMSVRHVRGLCADGKIRGAVQTGRKWRIPADAESPFDERAARHSEVPAVRGSVSGFGAIDKKRKQLDSLRPLTAGEVARLCEEFLVEFTHNSNGIEGNTLTLQETALVLKGITIDKKPLKDHLEAIGHKHAFEYVLKLLQDKVPLSERVIKELHSLVLMDKPQDRGVYRTIPVTIAGSAYQPPQPYLVPIQMEQLMTQYEEMKNNMHTVERVALFHLLFESIHPFIDGNGRTGRLLLNLDLMQDGYPPISVKFTHRRRYYQCFESYFLTGEHTEMVKLVSGYVEEVLGKYVQLLTKS